MGILETEEPREGVDEDETETESDEEDEGALPEPPRNGPRSRPSKPNLGDKLHRLMATRIGFLETKAKTLKGGKGGKRAKQDAKKKAAEQAAKKKTRTRR